MLRSMTTLPDVPTAVAGALLLVVVGGGLFLHDLGRYPLWDPDEARHAEVARELAATRGLRGLLLPTLELEPYREKPATYYWLLALAYRVAGVDAGAARAVSALAALALVLGVYVWELRRGGAVGAVGAGLVLATSVGCFGLARVVLLDMTLTAVVAAGVLAGLAWLERPPPRRPLLAPWVAAGLGVCLKGPIAALLVLGPLALTAVTRHPRPTPGELGLVRGPVVVLGIAALLWVPVGVLDASYLAHFAATNVRRFGAASPHAAPVHYYLVWVPLLFLPWSLLAFPALRQATRDPAERALLLWAVFVPAVLTLARGKLATYALSALPPLALLVGPHLARAAQVGPAREDRAALRAGGLLAALLLAGGTVCALVVGRSYPLGAPARALLGGTALVWALALAWLVRRDRLALVAPALLLATLTLYPLTVRTVAPAVSALRSDHDIARRILDVDTAPVIAFAARAPSLVFYLGRPVIRTEDAALVRELFEDAAPVFLVAGHRHFARLERLLGSRAHRWHGTARRRLWANVPPPG